MPDKRDHFLLGSEESDDEQGYKSEDELQKGRKVKRRRIGHGNGHGDSDSDSDVEGEDQDQTDKRPLTSQEEDDKPTSSSGDQLPGETPGGAETKKTSRGKEKVTGSSLNLVQPEIGRRNLVVSEEETKRSGVVYISRPPPFMKPAKLRKLLEPYGALNRIWLSPEDKEAQKRRVKSGGNKKTTYTEGWVEFIRKKDAKRACELLNARPIGGKKKAYYRDDLWSLLYLHGFKWHNLTEQIAQENAERQSRLLAERTKMAKENKEFVRSVEKAKMLEGMRSKSEAKRLRKRSDHENDGDGDAVNDTRPAVREPNRRFSQRPLAKKHSQSQHPEQVQRVLNRIF